MPQPLDRSDSATRARILAAARTEAVEHGFDFEMRRAARRAQLSRSTFYRHFNGRELLIRALVAELAEATRDEVDRLRRDVTDGSARLVAWMRFTFTLTERYGLLAIQTAADQVPDFARDLVDVGDLRRFLEQCIADCQRAGTCREGVDTIHAVDTYFALIHPDHLEHRRRAGRDLDAILEETVIVFFRAFAHEVPELV